MTTPVEAASNVHIKIDGVTVQSTVDPIIQNGSTLVPVRLVSESLGYKVEWNQDRKEVTVTDTKVVNGKPESKIIVMQLGNTKATAYKQAGGSRTTLGSYNLTTAPIIHNGSTMVPLRFIGEAFGAIVDWDGPTNSVLIKTTGGTTVISQTPIAPPVQKPAAPVSRPGPGSEGYVTPSYYDIRIPGPIKPVDTPQAPVTRPTTPEPEVKPVDPLGEYNNYQGKDYTPAAEMQTYSARLAGNTAINNDNTQVIGKDTRLGFKREEEITALARQITAGASSDYDKLKAVYDWFAENIYYGSAGDNIFETKVGMCGQQAELATQILRSVGIPTRSISGHADGGSGKGADGHVWNQSYVDGRWVTYDVTWASHNRYSGGQRTKKARQDPYKYFDVSIEKFSETHGGYRINNYW